MSKSAKKKRNKFQFSKHRIDYILVVDKHFHSGEKQQFINNFLVDLQRHRIMIDVDEYSSEKYIFLKIHITYLALRHFANVYGIDISNVGHNYIETTSFHLKKFSTSLTWMKNDLFKRRRTATSNERILIAHSLLNNTKFGTEENMIGLSKLLKLGYIKDAYPLHDGNYKKGNSNDRQLLYQYWANFTLWYKEQPLNLIEKYFGSEIAFYFAWRGFYNMMLIPAAIVGFICFLIATIQLNRLNLKRVDEICMSNLTLCPVCITKDKCYASDLKNSCFYAKYAYLFDNNYTIFFSVFLSLWEFITAVVFLKLWTRQENILKIRWNVELQELDVKTRDGFKDRAKHVKLSPTTGEMENYEPSMQQFLHYCFSYGICFFLIFSVGLVVTLIIMYRMILSGLFKLSNNKFLEKNSTLISMGTGSILQVIFIKVFGKVYGQLSEKLTILENPRTQSEFDTSVIHKRFFLGFINNYIPVFYIAFVKGQFFYPDHVRNILDFESDTCPITGCIIVLCTQIAFLLLLKSLVGNLLTIVVPKVTKKCKKILLVPSEKPQWVKEYNLKILQRYSIAAEYMEMVIQYGFIILFSTAFPLAPLFALLSNILEIRVDANKILTQHRRPVSRKTPGITPWDDILWAVTILSFATNAFILAFTNDFAGREIYRHNVDLSLKGYIPSTLTTFDMNDYKKGPKPSNINLTICYYRSERYPADHPKKYSLTPNYWYITAMKLLVVIIYEHFISLIAGIINYVFPTIPDIVKQVVNEEKKNQQKLLKNRVESQIEIIRKNSMRK